MIVVTTIDTICLSKTKFPVPASSLYSQLKSWDNVCRNCCMLSACNTLLCILSNFSVPSGFEGIKEQEICNKIMTKMLENYNTLFELDGLKKDEEKPVCEELARIILVKVSVSNISFSYNKSIMQVYWRLQFRNLIGKWEAKTVVIMFCVIDWYPAHNWFCW